MFALCCLFSFAFNLLKVSKLMFTNVQSFIFWVFLG
jgi:hypothetical protein